MSQPSDWKPTVYHDTVEYWRGCERRELVIARCEACQTWVHPPRPICPQCWSDNIGRHAVSGRARVYSYTSVPRPSPVGASTSVWAELVEQSPLLGVPDLEPASNQIAIGDALELSWREQ